jgi:SAM-dependent methyltransferase
MVKYIATALALKAFSLCKPTRVAYRYLGNKVGGRGRAHSEMPDYYVERVQRTLELARELHLFGTGSRVLELGTGWMHWEALTTRLFFDVTADLYDVWDNRQLDALKSYLHQLKREFGRLTNATVADKERAALLIETVMQVSSFEQLYQLLGFRYLLDPSGALRGVQAESYDVVVSAGVFEHLPRGAVPEYVRDTYRLLKPGGYAVHSINTTDHLHLYDRTASPKNYLRYSASQWALFFENEVQYINRLQRCEWLTIFDQAGFTCIEESGSRCDLTGLHIDSQYRRMDDISLETTSWNAVFQKPA